MTVQVHTLANGLRVATDAMPGLRSAAVGVWVLAGGRHERAEQNGIAHFLEHMAFKGTARRSALQIAEAIEDVGGYINAYTSRDATAYYARVLAADVPLALDVVADILLNPAFAEADVEVERGVILQEIGQALDTPDDIVFDWLQEAAYPDQPIGRTILGEAERVRAFDRADLRAFVGERYGPGQMILAAAGVVDHDAVCREAERLFGHLRPLARPAAVEPARWRGGERRELKSLEQVHVALAFPAPSWREPDAHAAQVWATAMGGGMSSRLFQVIREERGLCYAVWAQAGAHEDTGMATIYAGTSAEDLPELMALTADELRRAADDMTEAEVARAKAQLRAGLLMGLESPSSRAERMARMLQVHGRVPSADEATGWIDAVTTGAVRDLAARMAADRGAALALYGPAEAAPSLDAFRDRLAA